MHGLLGGHSGAEIHKQRGNANKMMGRLLNHIAAELPLNLVSICGGAKDNVITTDCTAKLVVSEKDAEKVCALTDEMKEVWEHEFMGDEPSLAVETVTAPVTDIAAFDKASTDRTISYIVICPNGVQGFARKLEGLVETSLNLGVIVTQEDKVKTCSLVRSSVESQKQRMKEELLMCAKLVNASFTQVINEYPAWQFAPDQGFAE